MISTQKTPESVVELRTALKSASARNPDAYAILKMTCHVPEARIKAIADGADPTPQEHSSLAVMA